MGEPTLLMRLRSLVYRTEWTLLRLPHPLWCRGHWISDDEVFGETYCSECEILQHWPS